jgi:putative AlgH/UPF0301 family transcriptional regulator
MLLHKLRFFTILAAMVAFASLENTAQVANEISRPHRMNAFEVKTEFPRPVFLPVQSKNLKDLAAGKLLVASRDLADPNFVHTVVLLVHYDDKSVVGLVLNRRTDLPLSRVLEGLKAAKDRSDRVYLGGPVETPAVFALLQSPKKLEGAEHVFGGVYLINTKPLFEQTISARPDPGGFHVYLGYAGWAKDQLRMEVAQGAWFIFQADAQTVFSADPDSLWPQMIRKTELRLARSDSADAGPWTLIPGQRPSVIPDISRQPLSVDTPPHAN